MELIEGSYGGWPVVKGEQWNADIVDWIELIGKMSRDGINTKPIVSVSISQDFKNSSKHILMVGSRQPTTTSYSDILVALKFLD